MLKKKKTMKKFNKKSEPIKKTIYRLNMWLQIAPRPNIQMISQLDLNETCCQTYLLGRTVHPLSVITVLSTESSSSSLRAVEGILHNIKQLQSTYCNPNILFTACLILPSVEVLEKF